MTTADVHPCPATTAFGTPCQKGTRRLSDGTWDHGGGHWFMSDAMFECLRDGHFDASDVLSMRPLVHLDIPCDRSSK